MIELCPRETCPHWKEFSFSHLIVRSEGSPKNPAREFIVCAHCRHNVDSAHWGCECVASCHAIARYEFR